MEFSQHATADLLGSSTISCCFYWPARSLLLLPAFWRLHLDVSSRPWVRAAERIQYRCLHEHGERVRDADEGDAGAVIDRVRALFPGVSRRLLFRQLAVQPDRQPPIERGDGAHRLAALDGDLIGSSG